MKAPVGYTCSDINQLITWLNTAKENILKAVAELENLDECPYDASDFDYSIMNKSKDSYFCCKMEIRACPEPSFTVVEHEGHSYNVSLLSNIIFWKKKYARKGVQKHIDDLITIETGVRPERKKLELSGLDLPF